MLTIVRTWLAALAAAAAVFPAYAQSTAPFPNRPVKIVVPYVPGGSTDFLARHLAEKLSQQWGQPVTVENRPGASTMVATDHVRRSTPDGYTLMLVTVGHTVLPTTRPALNFNPLNDLEAISQVAVHPYVLVSSTTLPVTTLPQLVALAKQKPEGLSYGSTGQANTLHLAGEMFNHAAGIQTVHVPYKGSAEVLTGLLNGSLHFAFDVPTTLIPQIKAGKLRALAVTSPSRMPQLPEVPSMVELGLPKMEINTWLGISGPKGTPVEVVNKVSSALATILGSEDTKAALAERGLTAAHLSPADFRSLQARDITYYRNIIRDLKIKLE